MPLFVGDSEGETASVILSLASNASINKSPQNSNVYFTNFLAEEITNKNIDHPHLLIRVTRAFIPCGLVPENHLRKTHVNDILQI